MAKKRSDSEEKPARGSKAGEKAAPRKAVSASRAVPAARKSAARPERISSRADRPRIHATHGSASATEGRERGASARSTTGARPSEGRLRAIPVRAPGASAKKPLPGARRTPGRPDAPTAVSGTTRNPAARKSRSVPPPAPVDGPSAASKELALSIASAGLDKKALGIEVLDVTGKVDYADFLVIMTGSSDRHVHAIATGIDDALRRRKVHPLSIEGLTAATWVLIDFDDVVVHVFQEDTRRIYDIEGLWMDASRLDVSTLDGPHNGANASNGAPLNGR